MIFTLGSHESKYLKESKIEKSWRATLKHIIIKLLKISDEEKIFNERFGSVSF